MPPPRPPRGPRPGGRGAGGAGKPADGGRGKPARPARGKPAAPGSQPPRTGGRGKPPSSGRGKGAGRKPPRAGSRDRDRSRERDGDRADRAGPRPDRRRRPEPADEAPQEWGGLARKAVGRLRDDRPSKASAAWRAATDDAGRAPTPQAAWERVDEVRDRAGAAVRRGRQSAPGTARRPVVRRDVPAARPPSVEEESAPSTVSTAASRLPQRLAEATRAFERERYTEARGMLRPLAQRNPGAPAVRELFGLTLYRLGQWAAATRELEVFAALTGSTEQHPVLADCARAQHRWARVEELWTELKAASPGAELVAEGRIVMAGALADQGRLDDAIALLEPAAARPPKKLREHHVRLLYALADLRERAGEVPAARALFRRILAVAPGFADVPDRLRALG